MNILYLLIPISILFLSLAVAGLIWSIKKGQYDDMDSPAHRILFDDDEHLMPGNNAKKTDKAPLQNATEEVRARQKLTKKRSLHE